MRYCIILLPFALLLLFAAVNGEPAKQPQPANNSSSAVSSTKAPEKVAYPKKVTSLKKRPTKSSTVLSATAPTTTTVKPHKSAQLVAASFKNLTADDLEFIEELDKQFNLHGDKIKIKVERENSTDSKTSKRTIESELGYGNAPTGYEYPKPKFMFYPYSQQDIPSNAPGYHSSYDHSSITIQPSYSYELNPQSFAAPATPQIDLPAPEAHSHHTAADDAEQSQQRYEEPIIVLRIPGPAKYASHLQTLLQQYLEIRAKQYLRILENSEQQHHHQAELQQHHQVEQQQHQQHFEHHYSAPEQQQQQQHYVAPQYEQPQYEQAAPQHEDYHQQELSYTYHAAPTPQAISYPAIDDVYQHYKGRHQHEHQQQHEQQPVDYAPQPQYYQQESYAHASADTQDHAEVPQYYYMHAQQYEQPGQPTQHEQHYQQIYLVAMAPAASQPIYEEPQEEPQPQHEQQHQQPIYVQDVPQQEHEQDQLPTSENNPRHTHTKVIFTHNNQQGAQDYSNQYALPSIKPHERHAPRITPNYQHYQQQHAAESASSAAVEEQPEQQHASAAHQEIPATPRPFNYHAHSQRGRRTRGSAKSGTTVVDPDEQFKQINKDVVNKLGAKKSHSLELKTTEVIAG